MSGTHTHLLFHLVFSTKQRRPWLSDDVALRLFPYIGGIVRSEKGVLLSMGGMEDHVHLLASWRPDAALSDLMRIVKARSSKWIHVEYPAMKEFAWQSGYGAFSVSKSREKAVREYISKQAEHHAKEDFKSEYLRLLRAHGVEFDEPRVFE